MQYKFKEVSQRKDNEIEIMRGKKRNHTHKANNAGCPTSDQQKLQKEKMNRNDKTFPGGEGLGLLDIQSLHLYIEDIEKVLYAICYLFCDQN